MVRMVHKTPKKLCITEDCFGKTKHILEFYYHEEPDNQSRWSPNTDIYETQDEVVIVVEAAGLDENRITLQSEGRRLILQGERKAAEAQPVMCYHQLEIQYMPFQKTFILPSLVDADSVCADYRNGLLSIRIPKQHLER